MKRKGFTVVEMSIGFAIAVVVIGALSVLLSSAFRHLGASEARLDVREQGRAALAALRERLSVATGWQPAASGAGFDAVTLDGGFEVRYDAAQRCVSMRRHGESGVRALATGVTAFSCAAPRPGFVRVSLEVSAPRTQPVTLTDEIFVQTLGSGTLDVPWNPVAFAQLAR